MSTVEPIYPTLELVREGIVERIYELKGPDLHLGRLQELDVVFDDSRVSRHHARIERQPDGTCLIIDLGAKSPTLLNGRKLVPFQPAPLRDGYRIRIVDQELVFRDQSLKVREREESGTTVLETVGDLSTLSLARRSPAPAAALQAVLEVIHSLGGGAGLNVAIGRVLDGLMQVFPQAERGFVLTSEPDGSFPLLAVRHRKGLGAQPELSGTILGLVVTEGKAVLISDALMDERFAEHQSVEISLRTAVCVPLSDHDGRPMGMLQLDSRSLAQKFSAVELDLLAALAVPIGVAVENHRLLSIQASWAAAGEIQRSLLPHARPDLPGYSFWECYRPALEVGGDLYDYIAVDPTGSLAEGPRRWAVTVGDVSGKGMPAALMMASTCPEVRQFVRAGVAPHDVITRVNRGVHERGIDNRFVTLVLAEIDPQTHRLTVAIAGHMLPLVVRASGAIEELGEKVSGMPLGVMADAPYRSVSSTLGPGDVVVLYSDGVTDSRDAAGEFFGRARLLRVLTEAPRGAAPTGEAILAAIREHAAGRPQFDDITLVCFGRDPHA